MSRKYNLFVVQSPLQLVMAQLARDHFCPDAHNDVIMVTLNGRSGRNACQMQATQDGRWRTAELVCHPKLRGLVRTSARLVTTARLLLTRGLPDLVFAGEHRNPWNRQLGALGNSSTFVDDGAAAIAHVRKLRSQRVEPFANGMPQAFSIFARPEDPPGLCQNTFAVTSPMKEGAAPAGVFVIGSKYAEMGYLPLQQEVASIQRLADAFTGQAVTYVAHRDETSNKLEMLREGGLKVIELDLPLELYLMQAKVRPKVLIGGFSTALFTCKTLFPDMACHAVRLPFSFSSTDRAAEIDAVYEDLARTGVIVSDLDGLSVVS